MHANKPLLVPQEAAAILRTSPRNLERWRTIEGQGPRYVKVGRRVAYFEDDLIKWAQSRAHTSTRRPVARSHCRG